jgi:hypothetical protein
MRKGLPGVLSVVVSGLVIGTIARIAPAAAVEVTVENTQYNVTEESSDFNDSTNSLEEQPWWGHSALAAEFAENLGTQLGEPYFAFDESGGSVATYVENSGGTEASLTYISDTGVVDYAVVQTPTVPEPMSTAGEVLAAGLAVALHRRRRKV